MDTRHRQVPVLGFECDEDIAGLIQLMNTLDIQTIMSCQDSNAGRGTTRRVWVNIYDFDLLTFLELLSRRGETGDPESLSGRIAAEWIPDQDPKAFLEDRAWHYTVHVERHDGESSRSPSASASRTPTSPRSQPGCGRSPGTSPGHTPTQPEGRSH